MLKQVKKSRLHVCINISGIWVKVNKDNTSLNTGNTDPETRKNLTATSQDKMVIKINTVEPCYLKLAYFELRLSRSENLVPVLT